MTAEVYVGFFAGEEEKVFVGETGAFIVEGFEEGEGFVGVAADAA